MDADNEWISSFFLASCTRLTAFPPSGITWGEVCDDRGHRLAGFASLVKPLIRDEIYPGLVDRENTLYRGTV